jgi:hypothetical protein
MSAIQEFLPLIFVVAFVIFSVRSGMNKKKQEELAKTTLPGRKSEPAAAPVREAVSTKPAPEQPTFTKPEPSYRITTKSASASTRPTHSHEKESTEVTYEPILNTEDPDELQKAIIYTEIFGRKAY